LTASAASLGDLDGDGVGDLAVGAPGDDDGGDWHGAVWALFLDGVAACPADFDDDGDVDTGDLLTLLAAWGDCPFNCPWDFNGDGVVDFADLIELQEHFGPCPLDECPTDIDGDGDTDTADLFALLAAWGECP
jgi:hypothetical protein